MLQVLLIGLRILFHNGSCTSLYLLLLRILPLIKGWVLHCCCFCKNVDLRGGVREECNIGPLVAYDHGVTIVNGSKVDLVSNFHKAVFTKTDVSTALNGYFYEAKVTHFLLSLHAQLQVKTCNCGFPDSSVLFKAKCLHGFEVYCIKSV